MYPKLLPLYGPFELNSYNTLLMVGIAIFLYGTYHDETRKKLVPFSTFFTLVIEAALAGILGARMLHILSSLHQYPTGLSMLRIWDGGLSILGAFIAVSSYVVFSSMRQKLPVIALADCVAPYITLIHGISRIGCFLVGCCYGAPTEMPWAVTYTDPQIMAPRFIPLHPSQLYSAAFYFTFFFVLWYLRKTSWGKRSGVMILLYTIGMSLERISTDFVRGDRIMHAQHIVSFHQIVAFVLLVSACILLIAQSKKTTGTHESF